MASPPTDGGTLRSSNVKLEIARPGPPDMSYRGQRISSSELDESSTYRADSSSSSGGASRSIAAKLALFEGSNSERARAATPTSSGPSGRNTTRTAAESSVGSEESSAAASVFGIKLRSARATPEPRVKGLSDRTSAESGATSARSRRDTDREPPATPRTIERRWEEEERVEAMQKEASEREASEREAQEEARKREEQQQAEARKSEEQQGEQREVLGVKLTPRTIEARKQEEERKEALEIQLRHRQSVEAEARKQEEERKEALEIQLRHREVAEAERNRRESVRLEGLSKKLAHHDRGPKQVDEVRKEALEVRDHLVHTPRDAHTPRADEPRKEALDVLAHLRERSMRSERSVRTPREDRIVEAAMARQMSKLERAESAARPAGGAMSALKRISALARSAHRSSTERVSRRSAGRHSRASGGIKRGDSNVHSGRFEEQEQLMAAAGIGAGSASAQLKDELARQEAEMANYQSAAKKKRNLHEVLNELLTTEASYLSDLHVIMAEFYTPLRPLLAGELHMAIFSNLEQLVGLHTKLAADLKPATESADDTTKEQLIISAFRNIAPFFKMYAHYSGNYAGVTQALAKARAIRKAEQFFSGAGAGQKASLEALLFRPVQRMCLYPLLFSVFFHLGREALSARVKLDEAEELTGRGSLGSKQSDLFRQVFECIQETLSKVNEDVRERENRMLTHATLSGEVSDFHKLVTAARTLVHTCHVDMKAKKKTLKLSSFLVRRKYKWYVFSDSLLVCNRNTMTGLYHKRLHIAHGAFVLRAGGSTTDGQQRASKRTSAGDKEKPEVFAFFADGVLYKCWAESADEMHSIVARISALQPSSGAFPMAGSDRTVSIDVRQRSVLQHVKSVMRSDRTTAARSAPRDASVVSVDYDNYEDGITCSAD